MLALFVRPSGFLRFSLRLLAGERLVVRREQSALGSDCAGVRRGRVSAFRSERDAREAIMPPSLCEGNVKCT